MGIELLKMISKGLQISLLMICVIITITFWLCFLGYIVWSVYLLAFALGFVVAIAVGKLEDRIFQVASGSASDTPIHSRAREKLEQAAVAMHT